MNDRSGCCRYTLHYNRAPERSSPLSWLNSPARGHLPATARPPVPFPHIELCCNQIESSCYLSLHADQQRSALARGVQPTPALRRGQRILLDHSAHSCWTIDALTHPLPPRTAYTYYAVSTSRRASVAFTRNVEYKIREPLSPPAHNSDLGSDTQRPEAIPRQHDDQAAIESRLCRKDDRHNE